jgi:hypothetical protein
VNAYPVVSTDMFLPGTTRENTPFSWTSDRFKLLGDYTSDKLPAAMRFTGGVEYDMRERTYQEVVTTREWTALGQGRRPAGENVSTWLRLEHSWRDNSVYGTSTWLDSSTTRGCASSTSPTGAATPSRRGSTDTVNAKVSIGLSGELTDDDYHDTSLGLVSARSGNLAAEVAFAISRRRAAAPGCRRSRSARSRTAARPSRCPTGRAR